MTRKRCIKLMMAKGLEPLSAKRYARICNRKGLRYDRIYAAMSPVLETGAALGASKVIIRLDGKKL